ncbi:MAG: hypothetical protein R3B09_22775 [Nannocystaceae bacterium]
MVSSSPLRTLSWSLCALLTPLGLAACGDDSSGTSDSATLSASGTGTTAGTTTGTTASSSESDTDTGTGSNSATAGTTAGTTSPGSSSTDATDTDATTTGTTTSSTSNGTGILFDVGETTGDTTTDDPPPKMGSCRPSEIHGAAGGFPKYTDPAYASFLDKKVAIMTNTTYDSGFVLQVIDIDGPPPPPNKYYPAPKYRNPTWNQPVLGKIFGLTLDSDGNIYVAPTTVFGPNGFAPGTIKRVDSITGAVTDFATIPNSGPALGNLNYDCVSETIYASNHEDGRVYQIDMSGQVVSTYRHSDKTMTLGLPNDPGEPDGQFVPLGQRVWAVQSHAGRLYYSVWKEDTGRQNANESNEIWSVGYADETGIIDPATAKLEFTPPNNQNQSFSNPVSDLSFAATGWMLINQRTMISDTQTSAHQSTTYEYQYNMGTWELKGTTFIIGELPGSSAGGVDHDFDEGGYVWMTGDALDFYTPDVVYGLQGTPHAGGGIEVSTLIDHDDEITQQDKTVMGDVELPIPGDAMPVPPPQ